MKGSVKKKFISTQVLLSVKKSLLFLHVEELRNLCVKLKLSFKGNQKCLILRVSHFLETGEELNSPKFPKISCAEKGVEYPLEPNTLMLKGAYKNDLKTRLFFKKIIGAHFHFTAFGIDWLNQRWLESHPPTYNEFALMWIDEYKRRKQQKVAPKEEWAYINFVQNFLISSPGASKELILKAWNQERLFHKQNVFKHLFEA